MKPEERIAQLERQRDYYRRRWIFHGLHYSQLEYMVNKRTGRPRPPLEELARVVARDKQTP